MAAGLCAVLEVLGCTVRHAATAGYAHEALDVLVNSVAFDFILSDVANARKTEGINLADRFEACGPLRNLRR